MNRKGHSLLLFLLLLWVMCAFLLFAFDWARADLTGHRQQTIADHLLLSSLRVRVQGLLRVGERREKEVQIYIQSVDPGGALIDSRHWTEVEMKTKKLKRSLSGYKGRTRGVIKVVGDAVRIPRHDIIEIEGHATDLGLTPEPQWAEDETGTGHIIDGLWIRQASVPSDSSTYVVSKTVFGLGEVRRLNRSARGQLKWEPDKGFPRRWSDTPSFRWPYYKSMLVEKERRESE